MARSALSGLLPVLLFACSAAAPSTSGPHPESEARVIPPLAPSPGAQVFLPPRERCEEPRAPRRAIAVFDDAGALSVKATPSGVALEAGGATAGRVLVSIAEATHESIHVEGIGASVRVYAHVVGQPKDVLVREILQAAGLTRYGDTIVDLDEAARRKRIEELSSADRDVLETRLVPAQHSLEVAAVLARLLLPCGPGRDIVAAPGRSLLVIRADAASIDRMESLVTILDAPAPRRVSLDASSMPGRKVFEVPEMETAGCDAAIESRAAPDLARGAFSSEGAASGALLRELGRARGEDVVVGCGGDRPAFFRGTRDLSPEDVARLLGLRRLAPGTYGGVAPSRPHVSEPYVVRGWTVRDADEIAVAAETALAPYGSVVAYAPSSMVLAAGAETRLAQVEAFVKAWPRAAP